MNKLWVRLSLTFTGVILIAVLIIVATSAILGWANDNPGKFADRFFKEPQRLVEQLTDYYQTRQSWDDVEWMLIGAQTTYRRNDQFFFLADSQEKIIYHVKSDMVGQSLSQTDSFLILPIQVKQQTVGYLGLTSIPLEDMDDDRPPPFIRMLIGTLLFIAAIGGLGGIVFGVVMSRTLTAPLNNLADAARAIGSRNLSQRVKEKGSDEMIAVARAFNEMATDLEQAEQLRRNLLADVAHELRTPLTVLQGNMRAILDEVFPCDDKEIARMYEHTRFLSRLVNDLHELAQAEAKQLPLDRQEIDLTQLIATTCDTFRPDTEIKEVRLNVDLSTDLPPIQVDAARLRQVLQNLLVNALRHTPSGGTITVGAEVDTNTVCLTIADTGEGISPEYLPHVFDRFYRADPARSRDRGGAGLGLAIARAIVEAHGGTITVASEGVPGQGSTFTIQLPVSQA